MQYFLPKAKNRPPQASKLKYNFESPGTKKSISFRSVAKEPVSVLIASSVG
jgi:hypothetical protein